MPIYEYQCSVCNHHFEAMQKFNDEPLKKCPQCGKNTLEKCISVPHFQLKGKGWYETDYKKKPSTSTKKEDKPESKKKTTESKDSK